MARHVADDVGAASVLAPFALARPASVWAPHADSQHWHRPAVGQVDQFPDPASKEDKP